MDWTCNILEAQFTEYGPVQQIRAEYLPATRQVLASVVYQNAEDAAACAHGERDGSMMVHALASAPVPLLRLLLQTKTNAAADAAAEAAAVTATPVLVVQLPPSWPALEPGAESSISPPLDPPNSPVCDERASGGKSCRVYM